MNIMVAGHFECNACRKRDFMWLEGFKIGELLVYNIYLAINGLQGVVEDVLGYVGLLGDFMWYKNCNKSKLAIQLNVKLKHSIYLLC